MNREKIRLIILSIFAIYILYLVISSFKDTPRYYGYLDFIPPIIFLFVTIYNVWLLVTLEKRVKRQLKWGAVLSFITVGLLVLDALKFLSPFYIESPRYLILPILFEALMIIVWIDQGKFLRRAYKA